MLPNEVLGICRLCLVKEHVNVNIFENNSRQLFYKIAACLPVSIAADDKLPKKVCLSCYNKVNLLYEFWKQTLDAEKHLLAWLNGNVTCSINKSHDNCDLNKEKPSNLTSLNHKIYDKNINHRRDRHMTDTRLKEFLIQTQEDNSDNYINSTGNGENFDIVENKDIKFTENKLDEKCISTKSNLLIKTECEEIKPGPSGFQDNSALKRLQGYTEELTNNSFTNLSKIYEILNYPSVNADICEGKSESESCQYDECDKIFLWEDKLKMQKMSHCSDDTNNKSILNTVEFVPVKKTVPKEDECNYAEYGKASSNKRHLQINTITDADSKSSIDQKCNILQKTVESQILTDEQTFVCNICEQQFFTRNSYIHHARSHKNITNKSKFIRFV